MDLRWIIKPAAIVLYCVAAAHAAKPSSGYVKPALSKKYDFDEALETWSLHGYVDVERRSLTEEARFQDLVRTDARKATNLAPAGLVLGKYVGKHPVPHSAIHFLISGGFPNPNLHTIATVHLMEEGNDDRGYWCRLVTIDPYYTRQRNCITYDFAIHIANDGVIRLMNPVHVSPKTPAESDTPDEKKSSE